MRHRGPPSSKNQGMSDYDETDRPYAEVPPWAAFVETAKGTWLPLAHCTRANLNAAADLFDEQAEEDAEGAPEHRRKAATLRSMARRSLDRG